MEGRWMSESKANLPVVNWRCRHDLATFRAQTVAESWRELWTREAPSLSTLSSAGQDRLPECSGEREREKNGNNYFRNPLIIWRTSWGTQHGEKNKRRKSPRSGPRRFRVTVQLATVGNVPNGFRHTRTHIKIKAREKKGRRKFSIFLQQGNDSISFSVANSTRVIFNPIIGTTL